MEKLASEEVYIDECAYVTIEIENLKNLYFEDVMVNEPITKEYVDNNKYQAIDLGISKIVPVFVDRVITFIESAIIW